MHDRKLVPIATSSYDEALKDRYRRNVFRCGLRFFVPIFTFLLRFVKPSSVISTSGARLNASPPSSPMREVFACSTLFDNVVGNFGLLVGWSARTAKLHEPLGGWCRALSPRVQKE